MSQRLHSTHHLFGSCVEFQSDVVLFLRGKGICTVQLNGKDGDVVRLLSCSGKGADFLEQSRGDVVRGLAGQRGGVGEQTFVTVTFSTLVECLSDAVGVKEQRIAVVKGQFSAMEIEARLEAERGTEIFHGPAWRSVDGQQNGTTMTGI